jgi:hypothetical protein
MHFRRDASVTEGKVKDRANLHCMLILGGMMMWVGCGAHGEMSGPEDTDVVAPAQDLSDSSDAVQGDSLASSSDASDRLASSVIPCVSNADCESGVCVAHLCPTLNPEASFCARVEGCVGQNCAVGELCVYQATGKFAINMPGEDVKTACVPTRVCGDFLTGAGYSCGRDWECISGDCIGVQCDPAPNAFAFGETRVCSASWCPATQLCSGPFEPLNPCVSSNLLGCLESNPDAGVFDCLGEDCSEALSDCLADTSCSDILDCMNQCPVGDMSCYEVCAMCELECSCEPGMESRSNEDGFYCLPEGGCL